MYICRRHVCGPYGRVIIWVQVLFCDTRMNIFWMFRIQISTGKGSLGFSQPE